MAIEEKTANGVINGSDSGTPEPRPNDRPNDERYDPQRVEMKWFERWKQDSSHYAAEPNSTKKKYYVLETWGTCATTPSATLWPATCG
jgi:hypothetical protein